MTETVFQDQTFETSLHLLYQKRTQTELFGCSKTASQIAASLAVTLFFTTTSMLQIALEQLQYSTLLKTVIVKRLLAQAVVSKKKRGAYFFVNRAYNGLPLY